MATRSIFQIVEIKNQTWAFIGLSIKSKKSALRNKTKVALCINEIFEDLDFGENAKFDGKIFTNLICGNNFERNFGIHWENVSDICGIQRLRRS